MIRTCAIIPLITLLLGAGSLAHGREGQGRSSNPRAKQAPSTRPVASRPAGQGLDSLDDDRVLTELAGRAMIELLRHAIETQGVSEERRQALLARISLSRLQGDQLLSTVERRELVLDVVANAQRAASESTDAQLLFEQAQLLISRGVDEEARLLEYFGDNPQVRQYLLPVTKGVIAMLQRAIELFQAQADEIGNRIVGPNDLASRQWQQADAATQRARDYRAFADYYLVLGLDPTDPTRLQVADALIEKVQPADNDQNPRRTFVQGYLGKVALARGNDQGLQLARQYLEAVLAASSDVKELFDAHYFRTVVEIEDRNFEEARNQFQRFVAWFAAQEMPERKPLTLVLEYRLADAESQYGPTEGRAAAASRAAKLVVELVEQHEEYRGIVTQQLLSRVEAGSDLAVMPPLLLDAVVDRGRTEAALLAQQKTRIDAGLSTAPSQGRVADVAIIEQGIAAAEELLRRAEKGDPEANPTMVARNAFLRGLMLDILDRKLEAAEAFVDFDKVAGADTQQRIAALRRALGIVEELRPQSQGATLARVDALEGRLLPLLVGPPVNDKSRAFELANRLHRLGELEGASSYYKQVPPGDPRSLDAAYLLVVAENTRLIEMSPTSPRRATAALELPRLAQRCLEQLQAAMQQAEGAARDAYRERVARVKVILARLALLEARDPNAALPWLRDIENDVQGLSDGEEILAAALPLRFQATAVAGNIEQATQDLLSLLERSDARRGLSYIGQFRDSINRAMADAEMRGDSLARWQLVQTRAAVTPRLVEWIEQKNDPEFAKYAYNFRRFDAETQYQAAMMANDRDERNARLRKALDAYRILGSAENLGRYRELLETLTPEQRQAVAYDRDVVFAVANIHYELGEYSEARVFYGRLLADRAIGNATRTIEMDGIMRTVPNDAFWELQLKWIRTNMALGNPPEPLRQQMRNLIAVYGDSLGGNAWQSAFVTLKAELLGQ